MRAANELLNPQVNPVHRRKRNSREANLRANHKRYERVKNDPIWCKGHNQQCLAHYHANREEILAKRYGITIEQWHETRKLQNDCCAVCGLHLTFSGSRRDSAFADHDHETGKFRGFLCLKCNVGLGYFDDPVWFEKIKTYLGV